MSKEPLQRKIPKRLQFRVRVKPIFIVVHKTNTALSNNRLFYELS